MHEYITDSHQRNKKIVGLYRSGRDVKVWPCWTRRMPSVDMCGDDALCDAAADAG